MWRASATCAWHYRRLRVTPLVPITMFGWILFSVALFSRVSPQRAVVICVVGGFLFLPVFTFKLQGFPQYDKFVAISVSLILGGILSGQTDKHPLRLTAGDIPMILWCFVSPLATAFSNGLGLKYGISSLVENYLHWGVFYWTGRRYFKESSSLRELSLGIITGTMVYLPLILFELRMSPQLSNIVYGFFPHLFLQHIRYGGWRPIVFTQHGLSLSLWMAMASTVTFWLWKTRRVSRMHGFSLAAVSLAIIVFTVLCKSGNGWFFLGLGIVTALAYERTRSVRVLRWIMAVILLYLVVRLTNWITIESVRSFADIVFDEERVDSLFWRLRQEDLFGAKAYERPWFGWGGYARGWPVNPLTGERLIEMVDSLWVILFNFYGFLGLWSVFLALGIAPWRTLAAVKRSSLHDQDPYLVDAIVLSLVVVFFLFDSLLNAGQGPVYILCSGALASRCAERFRKNEGLPALAEAP